MPAGGKQQSLTQFGDLFLPNEAAEPILGKGVRRALLHWLTEIFAEEELGAVGISARKRAIFDGPPGAGKTTLAHHLAARLGLPMLAVRPDMIIESWVGASAQNLGKLFTLAREPFALDGSGENGVPVVLFLDEFDSLAMKRRSAQQAADDHTNELVNTLLQRLEQHDGFVIAATNFGKDVDPAIWRRFDMHITLDLPGQFEREQILKRYLAPFGLPETPLRLMGEAFDTASPALMRAFCEGLKREIVIGPKLGSDMRKAAVVGRLIETVRPHPDLGKPPLWSNERAARERSALLDALPWPLPRADAVREPVEAGAIQSDNVVQLGRAK